MQKCSSILHPSGSCRNRFFYYAQIYLKEVPMGVLSNIFKARDKPENRTLHGRHNFLQGSNRAFCHADDGGVFLRPYSG